MTTTNLQNVQELKVVLHKYDIHLAEGKWSVHIATSTGLGKFFGPQRNEGMIEVAGKVVRRASCWLPRQIVEALKAGGFDCTGVLVA